MDEIFAWTLGLIGALLPGFGQPGPPSWNGYAEASYVYLAAPTTGTVETITVTEGDMVAAGEVIATLDQRQHRALLEAAEARAQAAEASLENLTTGSRDDEVEVIRATLQKAEADLGLARETANRTSQLFAEGLTPRARLDQDEATLKSAEAAVRQLEAQLRVAELPARDAQRRQAEAGMAAAWAEADKARADLDDRIVRAPLGGRVERVFFSAGEVAGAGVPLVALLPAASLKVKFYVPEAQRQLFTMGQTVAVTCDGCATGLTGTVSHFATEPQFTPPIIYSRDERHRLTFLVEARLGPEAGLLPGQPITVSQSP